MKTDLLSRLMNLALILYADDFSTNNTTALKKLYVDYYSTFNSKKYKLEHKKAFIKGPAMMKNLFACAITDTNKFQSSSEFPLMVNLKTTIIAEIIEQFDNTSDMFKGYSHDNKTSMVFTLIGLDQIFLVSQFEYGPNALKYVFDGKLANTGQWWANMVLNDFSDVAFNHANKLLQVTKNGKQSHTLNGASALFPTNTTYARFSEFVSSNDNNSTELHKRFSHITSPDFMLSSNLNSESSKLVTAIIRNYMFHVIMVVSTDIYRFENFFIGYYNMWRYNNVILLKNMHRLSNV